MSNSNAQKKDVSQSLDSIERFILNSEKSNLFSINERLDFSLRAKQLSIVIGVDSITIKSNSSLSSVYWEMGLYDEHKKINKENLNLSLKLEDSLSIASSHYNLAELYRLKIRLSDSAYYHYHNAEKIFKGLNEKFNTAETLLRIAIIQKNEKDFIGSEVTSIEAISLLESLEKTHQVNLYLSFIYNNLGIVFGELEDFDVSINYHKRALKLKKKLIGDNKATIDRSINNLALSYKNSRQYNLALNYYNQILKNKNLIHNRPDFYALVLDNYAHTLYLSNSISQLPNLYLKALKVCDSIGAKYNSIIINQHLAEYYNDNNKKDSALYYAYKAKDISQEYHNDDLLNSLLLLSKIEEDSMAVKHFNDYIILSDSLQKIERTIRNKFARIRFETKEIEQQNAQITKEKILFMVLSGVLLVTLFLLYVIITQRNKNKELQFVQQQQEANEEIYNLMLSQQDKIDEARIVEKSRISQELHDGVLGRLFGTRLSLDSLNMNPSPEAIKARSQYIDELKNIEQDLRKVSHDLNTDFVSGSGFRDIIKALVETQTKAYQIEYNLQHDDDINWDGVLNKTKIHIYRIIQESLQNIYKHANASLVKISFQLKNSVICLSIQDDGSGFDVDKARKGIGLKNFNSRVTEINGELDIESEKNIGTTIVINVPA